jgi:hypothetical protein
VTWTHPIDRAHPLMPDEAQCRRCGLAFIVEPPRTTYCSPACSAMPAIAPETQARRREAARVSGRASASDRGYGHAHRKRREKGLPAAYGTVCAWCGQTMMPGQALDLDHIFELARGGPADGPTRFLHARCNRQRAGRMPEARTPGSLRRAW